MRKADNLTVLIYMLALTGMLQGQAVIIDHNCTDITAIPLSAITAAKSTLHIAYGHTSHGSQLTDGMTGLAAFANGGGKGLSHPAGTFDWNNGGTGGALDLHDYAMGGDCGYYPDWVNNTTAYLNAGANSDVNVIIWSWCGQVDDKYAAGTLADEYLDPMAALEASYPQVTFVYMTGHVDHWDDADNKAANQMIRDYCIANGKVLYDFADIESYDPDGEYYEFPHDNCDYYESAAGAKLGNWASEWQGAHTEGVDWYSCSSAHSMPLNANQKAYAAWWLWARLAGWDASLAVQMTSFQAEDAGGSIRLSWRTASESDCAGFHVWRKQAPDMDYARLTSRLIPARGNTSDAGEYRYLDEAVEPGAGYLYRLEEVDGQGKPLYHGPVFVRCPGAQPQSPVLHQNYPNPFNPQTVIRFTLSKRADTDLSVYTVSGRLVARLLYGETAAGTHEIVWDGRDSQGRAVRAGVYICRLAGGGRTLVRKMTYLK